MIVCPKNRLLHLVILVGLALVGVSLAAQAAEERADVRLVIDVSGSMKRNDPQNLRQPAVDLLVRLMPEGSRAGVWTFGKYTNMLIPHQNVDDAWRDGARNSAGQINSVGLFTNIGEALEKASMGIGGNSEGYNKTIILLTDGMVDISKNPAENQAEWRRIVDKIIPKLQAAGITVHTVALSDNADGNLLEKLALATDGTAAVAKSADDLMQIFLKAFDLAAPAQQVPLTDNSFAVDSSVEEFTALIFRQQADENTQLIGPDEAVFDSVSNDPDVSWFRGGDYDLISVRKPLEGEWKVRANIAPESRITVVSDLQLRVKNLPNNVFSGAQESLTFALQEAGKAMDDKTFLSLLVNTVKLGFGPQDSVVKQVWSHDFSQFSPPADGIYRVTLPQFRDMGVYELAVLVDGKTFQRRFQHRIVVREPFTAELKESVDENSVIRQVLTVLSHSDSINPKKTQIAATVISPGRRKTVKPLGLTEFDVWQTVIYTEQPGKYTIHIQINGEDLQQKPFEYTLPALEILFNPDSGFNLQTDPVPPPPPEVQAPVTTSSEQSSPASSAAVSSAAVQTSSEPQHDQVEPPPAALPVWLLYVALGAGNVLILGGGYLLFRKLMADGGEDEPEQFASQPEPEPAKFSEPLRAEEIAEEILAMDPGDDDEEEPPMEDLEPSALDDPNPRAMANAPVGDDIDDGLVTEDDFGVDDLEDDTAQQSEQDREEALADTEAADLAAEMLKAQGLDLAEDDLDDAISNLIDELDGEPSEKQGATDAGDLDDFDFGDDDDDDDDEK